MKIKYHFVIVFAVIFLLIGGMGINIYAQDSKSLDQEEDTGATLEETLAWIKGKLKTSGSYESTKTENNSSFKIATEFNYDKCSGRWIYNYGYSNSDGEIRQYINTYSAQLTDFDPLSIKTEEINGFSAKLFQITLETTNNKEGVKLIHKFSGYTKGRDTIDARVKRMNDSLGKEESPKFETTAYFSVQTREDAKRISKALKHAITLCGGKIEPF